MANDELGEEYDEFRTTTGLKEDYDGIITDAYFGQGQTGERMNLFAKVHADDDDEVEVRWGIGNGWVSYDGGKTVEHPTERYFNRNTAWADAFTKMMEMPGVKEEFGKRSAKLERRGPRDARLIIGMKFHWDVKQVKMTVPKRDELGQPIPGQREEIEVPRVLPFKYLGTAEDQAPSTGKARKSRGSGTTQTAEPTAEASAPESAAASPNGSGIDANLLAKTKVLARTKSFPEWVDSVMDLPGAMDDPVLVSKLDEEFYESLKS
jgi:hypothetical protein